MSLNLIIVRYVVNKKGRKAILGPVSKVSNYLFRETQFEIASKELEWTSHDIDKNEEMGFLLGHVSKEAKMKKRVNI